MHRGQIVFKQIKELKNIELIFQTGVITNKAAYSFANNIVAVDISGKEYVITDKLMSTTIE